MMKEQCIYNSFAENLTGPYEPAELQTNHEFFDDFIRAIQNERRRAWVQNFYIEYCPEAEQMAEALMTAAGNRADSRVYVDGWSYMVTQGQNNLYPSLSPDVREERSEIRDQTRKLFDHMQSNGVKFHITNPPAYWNRVVPEVGRNHDKTFISGDAVWKGGVNVNAHEFKKVDFMVKLQDPRIVAEYTRALQFEIDYSNDRDVHFFPDFTLLFDGGRPGSSIIYQRTLNLLDQDLESIEYISQVPPRAEIADRLFQKAAEGTEINVYLPWKNSEFLRKKIHKPFYESFVNKAQQYDGVNLLHLPTDVHAKGIQVTLPTGKRVFAFGSHNFARIGVLAGTKESAIITTNPEINDQAQKYFESLTDIATAQE